MLQRCARQPGQAEPAARRGREAEDQPVDVHAAASPAIPIEPVASGTARSATNDKPSILTAAGTEPAEFA